MSSSLHRQSTVGKLLPDTTLPVLSRSLLWLMATAAGVAIANIYYSQPLLDQMQSTFGVDAEAIGWVPTLTQLGYALGILFLVPLGDMLQRKHLVVVFTLLGAVGAIGIALSPSFPVLLVLSFVFGLVTMTPQLLVPFAAHLARPDQKGRTVGFMVSGMTTGVLLARTVAGFVGAEFGWRMMFVLAAAILLLAALCLARVLPRTEPTYQGNYVGLLASVWKLFRSEPVLREACLYGAMLFGSLMVFWSNLIHLMESPAFQLGPKAVGLFALLGVGAAVLSPVMGGLADRTDPRKLTGTMIIVSLASYGLFYLGQHSLVLIALGVFVMDIGVRLGHVTNQGRVFRLVPSAQNRLQTVYMFCTFMGAAIGSAFGAWAWSRFEWSGVCAAGVAMLGLALIRWRLRAPQTHS